jgi:hypothetical protein
VEVLGVLFHHVKLQLQPSGTRCLFTYVAAACISLRLWDSIFFRFDKCHRVRVSTLNVLNASTVLYSGRISAEYIDIMLVWNVMETLSSESDSKESSPKKFDPMLLARLQ